jgi:hypothetical protein
MAGLNTLTELVPAVLQRLTVLAHTADTVYVPGTIDNVERGFTVAVGDKYTTKLELEDAEHEADDAPPKVNNWEHVNVDGNVGVIDAGEFSVRNSRDPEFENWAASNFGAGGDCPNASTVNMDTPFVKLGVR